MRSPAIHACRRRSARPGAGAAPTGKGLRWAMDAPSGGVHNRGNPGPGGGRHDRSRRALWRRRRRPRSRPRRGPGPAPRHRRGAPRPRALGLGPRPRDADGDRERAAPHARGRWPGLPPRRRRVPPRVVLRAHRRVPAVRAGPPTDRRPDVTARAGGARPPHPADRRRPGGPRLRPHRPAAGRGVPHPHRRPDVRRRRGRRRAHPLAHLRRTLHRARGRAAHEVRRAGGRRHPHRPVDA